FGYFDAPTNDRVLAILAGLLRPGGRLLLDLFHPGSLRSEGGAQRADGVRIENVVDDGRLRSAITYANGAMEVMDFELFTPEALVARSSRAGFEVVDQCCWWDES